MNCCCGGNPFMCCSRWEWGEGLAKLGSRDSREWWVTEVLFRYGNNAGFKPPSECCFCNTWGARTCVNGDWVGTRTFWSIGMWFSKVPEACAWPRMSDGGTPLDALSFIGLCDTGPLVIPLPARKINVGRRFSSIPVTSCSMKKTGGKLKKISVASFYHRQSCSSWSKFTEIHFYGEDNNEWGKMSRIVFRKYRNFQKHQTNHPIFSGIINDDWEDPRYLLLWTACMIFNRGPYAKKRNCE